MELVLTALIASLVVVSRAVPVIDKEGDIAVCGDACTVNQFCEESSATCVDCSLCVSSLNCTVSDCQADEIPGTPQWQMMTELDQPMTTRDPTQSIIAETNKPTEVLMITQTTSNTITYELDDGGYDGDGRAIDEKETLDESEKEYRLAFIIAVSGAMLVACLGLYIFACHPLGCRSKESFSEPDKRDYITLEYADIGRW